MSSAFVNPNNLPNLNPKYPRSVCKPEFENLSYVGALSAVSNTRSVASLPFVPLRKGMELPELPGFYIVATQSDQIYFVGHSKTSLRHIWHRDLKVGTDTYAINRGFRLNNQHPKFKLFKAVDNSQRMALRIYYQVITDPGFDFACICTQLKGRLGPIFNQR